MYLCFANTESRRRAEDNAFFRAVFRAGAIVSNRCVADAQQTEKMAFEIVETLFRGICVGVAASITVGPVAVLCIQRTLSKSRRSGIVSGIGVACADTFMAMAALFFYSMLQTQIEQYNTLLRVFKISGGDMADHTFGGFMRSLFVIAGFFGGAVAWWTLLAFVINLFRRRFRPRHMLTINHVAGLIIGILGIYTILSTFFDIFPNVGH